MLYNIRMRKQYYTFEKGQVIAPVTSHTNSISSHHWENRDNCHWDEYYTGTLEFIDEYMIVNDPLSTHAIWTSWYTHGLDIH